MDKYVISLGSINIKWYGLIIVFALLLGIFLFFQNKNIKQFQNKDLFYDYFFWMIICCFLGARIWYVTFELTYYINHLDQIIAIWNGGLAIHGGILGGVIYTYFFCKKNKIDLFVLTDALVPSLILGQAIGRWGNFVNQEAHGPRTTRQVLENIHLPKFIIQGMQINGIYYQPTFLYESMWNLLGFILIILFLRNIKKRGIITAFYLIWYGVIRAIIEQFRTDALYLGNLKIAQITSLFFIFCGIYIIILKVVKIKGSKNEKNY